MTDLHPHHEAIRRDKKRRKGPHGDRRKNAERAVTTVSNVVYTVNGQTVTFSGDTAVQTSSLLLGGGNSNLPTTQTHSHSSTSLLVDTNSSPSPTSPNPSSPSPSPTTSTSASQSPTAAPAKGTNSSGFISNHKLLLAGIIAGFVALAIVICLVVWLFIRRSRRKKTEDVARQSFVAGTLLNSSAAGSTPKNSIPMGEVALFKTHDRKKGSRSDDWAGLGSRDDRFSPQMDALNDASSMRSGGHRSPYTPPFQLSFGAFGAPSEAPASPVPAEPTVPAYTLTGAFANALSAEDDEEREQSASNTSHLMMGSPRIERGPQMRVAQQTHSHPHHPFADPSVLASAVTAHHFTSSSSAQSSPTRIGHEEPNMPRSLLQPEPDHNEQQPSFLSITPSTAPLSDQQTSHPYRADYFGNAASSSSLNVPFLNGPPSPSSLYSEQSGAPSTIPKPGPVMTSSSRVGLTVTAPSSSSESSNNFRPQLSPVPSSPRGGAGLQPKLTVKQSKQERANNFRALSDLIAALDGPDGTSTPGTGYSSSLSPSDAQHSRMPDAAMWRAALGSSPTLGARQASDGSHSTSKKR